MSSEFRHPRAGGDPSGQRKPLNRVDSRRRGNDIVEGYTKDFPFRVRLV
jgi:hypothetical protein